MARRRLPAAARVRMYRQGLGDCFLLTLPRAAGGVFHVLIDCGVLLGTPNAKDTMTRIAQDIAASTGSHLDVVIVTHEHWDHLSGFIQAKDVFDTMTVEEVWLAWTEDPADGLADQLRSERQRALRGLRVVANRIAESNATASEPLRKILDLFGAAPGPGTRAALDYLIGHPSQPRVRYFRPGGTPVQLPVSGEARVFILGPPHDLLQLRRSDPTRTGQEVYDFTSAEGLFAAVGGLPAEDGWLAERSHAFEPRYRLTRERAEGLPFFRANYFHSKNHWQNIDSDWLGAAEQLALKLDHHTNNTSLALAIELEPGGPVLLFPGDAQVGNWLSWENYQWQIAAAPTPAVTAGDLLHRTVFYKVGHHASHNATLRAKGLELMASPELVAMIPICQTTAERMKWNMPFPSLLKQLHRKTRGRVLRADKEIPTQPDGVSEAEWAAFTRRVTVAPNGLYFEYAV